MARGIHTDQEGVFMPALVSVRTERIIMAKQKRRKDRSNADKLASVIKQQTRDMSNDDRIEHHRDNETNRRINGLPSRRRKKVDNRKKNKRTKSGTGAGCLALNVKDQKDCPFLQTTISHCQGYDDEYHLCNINDGKDCEPHSCLLRRNKRVIVDWRK
jgi:hypothetical protein